MPFPFLKLPGELRNAIYQLVLAHDHDIEISRVSTKFGEKSLTAYLPYSALHTITLRPHMSPENQKLFPSILLTNREISREASVFLYSKNRFLFFRGERNEDMQKQSNTLSLFLKQIGSWNASSILQLSICFPICRWDTYWPQDEYGVDIVEKSRLVVVLESYSQRCLAYIQKECTNLRDIEIHLDSPYNSVDSLEYDRAGPFDRQTVLSTVNNFLRTIPSLTKITAVASSHLSDILLHQLKHYNWLVRYEQPKHGYAQDIGFLYHRGTILGLRPRRQTNYLSLEDEKMFDSDQTYGGMEAFNVHMGFPNGDLTTSRKDYASHMFDN